jgi:hypothetical protein
MGSMANTPTVDRPHLLNVQQALLIQKVDNIACDVADIKSSLKGMYVTRAEFEPIRNLVYGAVGLILIAFLTALIALVITRAGA